MSLEYFKNEPCRLSAQSDENEEAGFLDLLQSAINSILTFDAEVNPRLASMLSEAKSHKVVALDTFHALKGIEQQINDIKTRLSAVQKVIQH